jgi:transcriptional regulator with XRE-family HTH domain
MDRGLSQTELGALVGVRQSKISDLEHGQTGVRISLVLQIISALNLTVDIAPPHAEPNTRQTSPDDLDELDAIANTGLKT